MPAMIGGFGKQIKGIAEGNSNITLIHNYMRGSSLSTLKFIKDNPQETY
jgi:hypothetical protein